MRTPHIWLRAETKPHEERTALTPNNAKALIDAGFSITIESSEQSIFEDEEYIKAGCELRQAGEWKQAPSDAFVLGLKELPEDTFPLSHNHIYFAHAYKEQQGWQALLQRFVTGKGALFDLEYLLNDQGRRIAAFGYWAGYAGAALGLKSWLLKKLKLPQLNQVKSYANKQALVSDLAPLLAQLDTKPKLMIIGAKGRSGSGAVGLANDFGLETIAWDLEETQRGGPFMEINRVDILINCVFMSGNFSGKAPAPFITLEELAKDNRQLSVIADVSCDPYGAYNPLPIYDTCTTFESPCLEIIAGDNSLDLISIDHLPSLLPRESSEDYGEQLTPYLATLDKTSQGIWPKATELFSQKSALANEK